MVNFLGKAKGWIVTMVIMFLGINLNIAGDAGFIVLPPLAAILYMSIGRHPLLGMYTAFASVAPVSVRTFFSVFPMHLHTDSQSRQHR